MFFYKSQPAFMLAAYSRVGTGSSYIPDAKARCWHYAPACMPTVRTIIDHAPDHHDRLTLATGFSGHGFKFAPVIGEILADLSTKGSSSHSIDLFSFKQFA